MRKIPPVRPPTAAELVERLFSVGDSHVPERLSNAIMATAPECIPPLLAIVSDLRLLDGSARGRGIAPCLAAHILGDLRAAEAVGPLFRMLRETDVDDWAHDAATLALSNIGAPVVEPALAEWDATTDSERRAYLGEILAGSGVHDNRILERLVQLLDEDPSAAAGSLGKLGDRRALPALARALDLCELDEDGHVFGNQAVIELAAAIEELGGELTRAQVAKRRLVEEGRHRALAERSAMAAAPPRRQATAVSRPGRNERCPCGSGRKYKKCHLADDNTRDFELVT